MDRQERPEWRYKAQAIKEAARAFREALKPDALDRWTFAPIPPSKARRDPLYDDRLLQMLRAIRPERPLDTRELIVQTSSIDAAHAGSERPTPDELKALYRIDEALADPDPDVIAVVDDVLTTGAHFKAAESVLSDRFPNARVVGLFLARRAVDASEATETTDPES